MSNLELMTKGIEITGNTLRPYVVSELKSQYGDEWWEKGVYAVIFEDKKQYYKEDGTEEEHLNQLDLTLCLVAIDQNWYYFKKKLPHDYKSWVHETKTFRNLWAHQAEKPLTDAQLARALETMSLLCQPIDAKAESDLQELVRTVRYGSASGSVAAAPKKIIVKVKSPRPSNTGLKSWRDVIMPHPDVAEGRYKNAEFAANLSDVISGKASYEYRDPVEFFGRTYITTGMRTLLTQALERVTGKGGEPVIELKTAFGGGKTHSMLALYHMLNGHISVDNVPILAPIIHEAGLSSIPTTNIAVIVGTTLSVGVSRRPSDMPGITINTIWGEIAYQLAKATGKPELYDIIREADRKGVNPGSELLGKLFSECGSCMILIDELVSYAKNLPGGQNLPAGTYDNFISFIQSLTEAVSSSDRCVLIVSVPESDIEIGGENGELVLQTLSHYLGRKEAIWKPVEANEGFEVVRRRLFGTCNDTAARDAVCEAYFKMYRENPQDFPIECRDEEYLDRMKSCYPIHPEVFDRLYDDWATLERFQRTRGVLRLMAAVINDLWSNGNDDTLILPSTLPINNPMVKEELLRYLASDWSPIVDSEVDGSKSTPFRLDQADVRFGQMSAARKVARTIFFGSAPGTQISNRGIEKSHIMLGCMEPGERTVIFNDAITALLSKLSYLYNNASNDRFWYDTRPTLRKLMEDRANRAQDEQAIDHIKNCMRNSFRKGDYFRTIHVAPETTLDVPDDQEARLVIMSPSVLYSKEEGAGAEAISTVESYLSTRGTSPRMYKNMLAFAVMERKNWPALLLEAKKYLAWKSIDADKDELNLSKADKDSIIQNIQSLEGSIKMKLNASFSWLINPKVDIDNQGHVILDPIPLSGSSDLVPRIEKMMTADDSLIHSYAPVSLLQELDNILWKNSDDIVVKDLWKCFTSYCYLPRLIDYGVLQAAISSGVSSDGFFAIADGKDSAGKYINLRWETSLFTVDRTAVIVKKSIAEPLLRKVETPVISVTGMETETKPSPFGGAGVSGPFGGSPFGGNSTPAATGNATDATTFFLTHKLDSVRFMSELNDIYKEVISKLLEIKDSKCIISIEVSADFEKGTVSQSAKRAIEENCRALKIEKFEFES